MQRLTIFILFIISMSLFANPPQCADLLEKLQNGHHFENLIVIVHQNPELDEETLKLIHTYPPDTPILFMKHSAMRLPEDLPNPVAYIYSNGTPEGLTIKADDVALCGGSAGSCLSRAVKAILGDFRNSDLDEMSLSIDGQATYGATTRADIFAGSLRRSANWKTSVGELHGGTTVYELRDNTVPEKVAFFSISFAEGISRELNEKELETVRKALESDQ